MFSANLTDDVRMIAEDIAIVQEKVDDPVMCQKIEQYATAPFEIQEFYRKDAGESRCRAEMPCGAAVLTTMQSRKASTC